MANEICWLSFLTVAGSEAASLWLSSPHFHSAWWHLKYEPLCIPGFPRHISLNQKAAFFRARKATSHIHFKYWNDSYIFQSLYVHLKLWYDMIWHDMVWGVSVATRSLIETCLVHRLTLIHVGRSHQCQRYSCSFVFFLLSYFILFIFIFNIFILIIKQYE